MRILLLYAHSYNNYSDVTFTLSQILTAFIEVSRTHFSGDYVATVWRLIKRILSKQEQKFEPWKRSKMAQPSRLLHIGKQW